MHKRYSRSHGAFTIVELLIVIVIIAILAAIMVAVYNGVQARAVKTALQSDLRNAATKVALSKAEKGNYPTDEEQALALFTSAPGTHYEYSTPDGGVTYLMTITSDKEGIPAYCQKSDGSLTEGACPGHSGPSGGGGGGVPIADGASMQSITSSSCAALPVYDGTNSTAIRTLTDSRGGTVRNYRIAKLADNKCWMLDNLKLGFTATTIALTPADTDISNNFTLPVLFGSGGSTTAYFARAYGPVPGDTGSGATNYGYLYNWMTATAGESLSSKPAGSGNAPNSICPKGWGLPTGGVGVGDFADLDRALGGSGTTTENGTSLPKWRSSGVFKATPTGYFSGSFTYVGRVSQIWSGTAHTSSGSAAFALIVGFLSDPPYWTEGDYVFPGGAGLNRDWGRAIRCIAD